MAVQHSYIIPAASICILIEMHQDVMLQHCLT